MPDKSAVKILLVDDEPFVLKLHSRILANLGYQAVTTCDGALSAMAAVDNAANTPNLILLDINMPEMDGVEFVRHLVQRDYVGSLILVSGEDTRMLQALEKLAQAHRITTLGFVQKPLKPDLLAAIMERWAPPPKVPDPEHWSPLEFGKTASIKKVYPAEEIRLAIANYEFVNYYQPKVSLQTGQMVGVETLVRWKHPEDGLIFPDQFIAVAEAHGLIRDLTRMVFTGALGLARRWRQQTGSGLQVAINVSMDDLGTLEFADYVTEESVVAGAMPKDVTLEVTESRLMEDIRVPLDVLTRLRLKRFRLSIDDFGTGHSSLAQLRDMPFDELKIDQSFVHNAWGDEKARAIFKTSESLGRELNMSIVAEGVEDRADWDFVRKSGCDVAQGYFIAKPMPEEKLRDWTEEWEERALVAT